MIPPQLPGSPSYLQPGTPSLAKFLLDQGYTTGEFGKNHLGDHSAALPTAHGFQEFWGYLYHLDAMQGVSFPDINKTPTEQAIAPPCKNTPVPGLAEVPGAVDQKTHAVHDAAAPGDRVHVLRRHREEPDVQGRGAADARAIEDRRTRRYQPRLSTSSTATTRRRPTSRSLSGTTRRACTSPRCCRRSTWRWWVRRAARTGASTKPA